MCRGGEGQKGVGEMGWGVQWGETGVLWWWWGGGGGGGGKASYKLVGAHTGRGRKVTYF